MLSSIRKIRHRATLSTELERHELAWNKLVHAPLLGLVFDAEEPDYPSKGDDDVTVRLKLVMSAAMSADSTPRVETMLTLLVSALP
ncbi:hypothetical protein GGS24DRAFT_485484 [Hypoxylon argillaceum]|nr:hypothetical protein GGS24DRAFT_485484 [Hypoxylon argillaceum]